MKHHSFTVLATLFVTFGLTLAAHPSFAQTSTEAGTGSTAGAGTAGTGNGHHNWKNNGQSGSGKQNQSGERHNPACERILDECKKMGFIQGQWKKDNGLWKDCFDPIVKGKGNTTQDGKPINIPVSQGEIESCRASEGKRAHGHKGAGTTGAAATTTTTGTTGK